MKKILIIFLLLIIISEGNSQGVFKGNYWKQYRKEVTFGIGATNFLGELGGRDQIGTDFAQDLEINATRFVVQGGYRYYLRRDMAVRGSLFAGVLSGDDKLTNEPYRNNRGLHFRSQIVEGSAVFEYHPLQEKSGAKYKIKGSRGVGRSKFGIYGFGGIGFFFFNPQGQYTDGKWYNLKPLGTEGQGLPGGPAEYSNFGLAMPYGFGFRYLLRSKWRLSLEAGLRKTFTDYIDDVSTVYYDKQVIEAERGPIAAYFSNPNTKDFDYPGLVNTATGQQRGDPEDKDTYMFLTFNLSYKIVKTKGFKRIRSRRSVPSF